MNKQIKTRSKGGNRKRCLDEEMMFSQATPSNKRRKIVADNNINVNGNVPLNINMIGKNTDLLSLRVDDTNFINSSSTNLIINNNNNIRNVINSNFIQGQTNLSLNHQLQTQQPQKIRPNIIPNARNVINSNLINSNNEIKFNNNNIAQINGTGIQYVQVPNTLLTNYGQIIYTAAIPVQTSSVHSSPVQLSPVPNNHPLPVYPLSLPVTPVIGNNNNNYNNNNNNINRNNFNNVRNNLSPIFLNNLNVNISSNDINNNKNMSNNNVEMRPYCPAIQFIPPHQMQFNNNIIAIVQNNI